MVSVWLQPLVDWTGLSIVAILLVVLIVVLVLKD